MIFLLLVLVTLAVIVWKISAHRINVPGPTQYPIIGSLPSLLKNSERQHLWSLELARNAGWKTCGLSTPGFRFFLSPDPKNVEYILKTNFPNFQKGNHFLEAFEPLLGRGIFNVDGEEWKTNRKVASHMFSHTALKTQMEHVFLAHGETVMRILENAAKTGETIDIQRLFQSYTFDSICEIAFGVNPHALEKGENEFQTAFDQVQQILVRRFFLPPWLWKILRSFNFLDEPELQKGLNVINKYIANIIKQRTDLHVDGEDDPTDTSRKDLLSLNLAYAKRIKDPSLLTPTYLRDLVMNFLLAGRDTTGSSLTFFFKTMNEYPEEEKKFHEVVDQIIPDASFKPTFESLKGDAAYLKALIYETIRLNPPVPSDGVFAEKDDTLPDGTFIPAGSGVSFAPYVVNRNPAIYSEPEKFLPSRWLDEGKVDPFKFPTFKAGPRICLGKDMAIFEIQVLALMIGSKYRIRCLPGQSEDHAGGAVLFLKNGLKAKVERREKSS